MTINPQETEQIRRWNDQLTQEITLRFRKTEDERSQKLEAFCDSLTQLAPKVRVIREKGEGDEEKLPALQIEKGWTYHAVPEGKELAPFLEILSMTKKGEPEVSELIRERIKEVRWPAHFTIYVTPSCPFCPQVVKQMAPFPLLNPEVRMTVIDGSLFHEMAGEDQIRAVPTVILDDQFRWTGSIKTEDVLDALIHRDPAQFGVGMLKNMLKQGEASRLAEMMLEKGQFFSAFLDLVTHPEWSVRLGALVVMEEIMEQNASLIEEALESLWERMEGVEDNIKGDLIYLFGESGDSKWIPRLEKILKDAPGDEIREMAEEGLEKLRNQT